MKEELSVGLVGCGEVTSRITAPAINEAKGIRLGMAMDTVEWAAADIGRRYGIPWTTNLDDLLSNPEIDVVYIATPHYLHTPLTIKAARAGKHVIVEKPIATTLKDAELMIRECERCGVYLSTHFPVRYMPEVKKARELVNKGIIGKVVSTRIVSMGVKPPSYWVGGYTGRIKSNWRASKEKSGGGILIMNAIHDIDSMLYITGLEVKRVYAEYDTFLTPVEVEDLAYVVIRYTSGAIGMIEASSCFGVKPFIIQGNRIYGAHGQIIVSNPLLIKTDVSTEIGEANKWHELRLEKDKGHVVQFMEDFARAVLAGKSPPVSGEDGKKALEVVIAAYESAKKGSPINLPIID